MATRYWVGGAGTWDTTTTTNWSASSGGASGASAPLSTDDVIIDTSSGTGTITCTAGVCNNLTVTASQAIILGAASSTLAISGNLSLPSGGSFSANTSSNTITFAATSTGKTITTNGKALSAVTFNGVGGGWTLQDALNCGSSRSITLTNGSFNANNFNVTAGSFGSSNSNTRTLTMGSGTWTLGSTGSLWNIGTTTGLTFNANTSTIALSDTSTNSKEFRGGGLTYNNLSITGATGVAAYTFTGSINNSNTFNSILSSKTVAYTITLSASSTTTVTTWSASGLVSNLLTLNSSTSGTAATLAVTNAFTVNYATIQDVNMSATLIGTAANSNVINSNNWQIATTSTRWLNPLTSGTSVTTPSDWPTTAVSNIHVIGGGGGGAGNVSTLVAGGAGGGGGGYALLANTTLAASTTYGCTIGAGGTGSAGGATTQTGGTGGTSSFSTPISYVSSAVSVQNTSSTTISVTVPSVSNGNLMVMIVQSTNNGVNWTTPSGWTASSAGTSKAIFYRTASSEPASYTVTQDTSTTSDAFIIAYSNATFDTAGAIGANASPVTPAAITVAVANSTIVYYAGRSSGVSITYTTPTGYTARASDSDATAPSAALFDLANVAAGSYTAPSTTPSTGTTAAVVIALSPATLVSATGGAGGVSTTTPTSTGGTGGTGSGGTPTYVAQSTAVQNTSSTTIAVNVPTGTANGDLLILMVMSNSGTWTTPSGWTVWLASANNRAIYYRTASSEPASYTITQGSSTTASACMLAYQNAAIDVMGTITAGNTSPNTATAITTTANNTIVFDYVASNDASLTFSTPSGYTSLASDSDATAPSYALFYKTQATAGTTGTAATTFASGTARSILFAIKSTATVYTGGTGGVGGTSGTIARSGGGGGGAAGPNGNGGTGGAGVNSSGTATNVGAGSGGGNGGGTAGAAGTATIPNGAGGNNSLGTGGGAAVTAITTAGNPGTLGGGGSGNVGTSGTGAPGIGGDGIDIISVLSDGSGGGGAGSSNNQAGATGGLYGGGGGGNGRPSAGAGAGGAGAQGAIFVGYTGTYVPSVSTGNFFFLFM